MSPRTAIFLFALVVSGCDGGTSSAQDGGVSDGGACAEPVTCPAADRTVKPVITCISPSTVKEGASFTLEIYGSYLKDSNGSATKVSFDGEVADVTAASNCHLTVTNADDKLKHTGAVPIYVVTSVQSSPAILTVQ